MNVKTGGKYKKVRIYNKCNKNEIGTDHIQYYYLEKTERSYYNDVVVGLLCLKRWECHVWQKFSIIVLFNLKVCLKAEKKTKIINVS